MSAPKILLYRSLAYDVMAAKPKSCDFSPSLNDRVHRVFIEFLKVIDFLRLALYYRFQEKLFDTKTIWMKSEKSGSTKIEGAWNIIKSHYRDESNYEVPANKILISKSTKINAPYITFPYQQISRLGDYAKFYLNAKFLAEKLGVTLVMRSFPESTKFKLSEDNQYYLDQSLGTSNFKQMTKQQVIDICSGKLTKEQLGKGIFSAPFFCDWEPNLRLPENRDFRDRFVKDFMPASHIHADVINPIPGKINIAIHVRDGGTFDNLKDKFLFPVKFPDISFYDTQLKYVLNLPENQNKPIHVQIFTDSENPESIKARLQNVANECGFTGPEISFECRPASVDPDEAILSDLISMSKFPIVIRARSGFSDLSMYLGQPAMEIFPEDFELNLRDHTVAVTTTKIIRHTLEGDIESVENQRFEKTWPGTEKDFIDNSKIFRNFWKGEHLVS